MFTTYDFNNPLLISFLHLDIRSTCKGFIRRFKPKRRLASSLKCNISSSSPRTRRITTACSGSARAHFNLKRGTLQASLVHHLRRHSTADRWCLVRFAAARRPPSSWPRGSGPLPRFPWLDHGSLFDPNRCAGLQLRCGPEWLGRGR